MKKFHVLILIAFNFYSLNVEWGASLPEEAAQSPVMSFSVYTPEATQFAFPRTARDVRAESPDDSREISFSMYSREHYQPVSPHEQEDKEDKLTGERSKKLSFSDLFFSHFSGEQENIQRLYAEVKTPQSLIAENTPLQTVTASPTTRQTPSSTNDVHPNCFKAVVAKHHHHVTHQHSAQVSHKNEKESKNMQSIMARIKTLSKKERKKVAEELSSFANMNQLEDTLTPQQHRDMEKKQNVGVKSVFCGCCSSVSKKSVMQYILDVISTEPEKKTEKTINREELASIVREAISKKKESELRRRKRSHEPAD
jgi:hypothetical protein